MADAFRGLTLRIGADARPLQSAISNITRSASQAQKQMNRLNKALKFDGANVKAIESKLDLMGDKAIHSARAMQKIKTAMQQAAAEAKDFDLKKLADQTKDAYNQTQKLREEYNHVDATLQHVYDAVARSAKKMEKFKTIEEAVEYVKMLKEAMRGTGESAEWARQEFDKYLKNAAETSKINEKLGIQKNSYRALKAEVESLVTAHKSLNAQYEKMNTVQGYRAMKDDVKVYEAEVRQAAEEMARLRSEMFALGTGGRLSKSVSSIQSLGNASEKAVNSAHQMIEAYRKLPINLDRVKDKVQAVAAAETTLNAKSDALKEALRKIESDPAFDKLAASSSDAYLNAVKVEEEYADIATKLNLVESEADELRIVLKNMSTNGGQKEADDFKKLQKRLVEAESSAKELRAALASLDDAHATASLITEQKRLKDALAETEMQARTLHSQMSKLNAMGTAGKSLRQFGFGMYASLTPAAMMAGRYMIQSAEDVDAAYRDMRKTVNATDEEFQVLLDHALEFSTTHVTTADQILEIEAMGGQLGIAYESLESFAHTVSNLDIATNMQSDEISEQLGKMATVMGMTEDEYDNFGDALVRLGNNMPVMESDVMNLTNRFMGMAKVVGMSPDQMLAWAAAASATGQKAEAAGSSMMRFISNMETAVNGSDEQLKKWADVAGMSVQEFRKSFGEDASGTMYRFVQGLGEIQKSGGSVNQVLEVLGINNVRDKQLLEGLANQMANGSDEANTLAQALQMSNDAWNGMPTNIHGRIVQAGDAMREAEKKSEGFSGSIQKLRNQATDLMVELGKGAQPIVDSMASTFGKITKVFQGTNDALKTFVIKVGIAAAAIGPATVGLGTFLQSASYIGSNAIPSVKKGFVNLGTSIMNFSGKMTHGSNAVMKLGYAIGMLGTGSTLSAVAGLAAVGGAIYLVVSAITSYIRHVNNLQNATDGTAAVTQRFASLSNAAAGDLKSYSDEAEHTAMTLEELADAVSKTVDAQNARVDAAENEIGKLSAAQQIIERYANTDLSGNIEAQGKLRAAVDIVNDACGTQIEVLDAVNGKLRDEAGEIDTTTSALVNYIEQKKEQIRLDAMSESLTEAYENQAQAFNSYMDTQMRISEERAKLRQAEADGNTRVARAERETIAKLEEAAAGELEIYQQTCDQIDVLETQMGNYDNAISGSVDSVRDLVKGNYQLFSALPGEKLDKFAAQLEAAGITMDEFYSLSNEDLLMLTQTWLNNGNDMEAALKSIGLSTRSLAELYQAEMENVTGSTESWQAALDATGMSSDELAKTLQGAGISANQFAKIGGEAFGQLYNAAGNDIDKTVAMIDVLNAAGIDPKEVEITTDEDGITRIGDQVLTLNENVARIGDRKFKITAEGNWEELAESIDESEESFDEYGDYLDEFGDEVEETIDSLDGLVKANGDLISSLNKSGLSADEFARFLDAMGVTMDDLSNATPEMQNQMVDAFDTISGAASKCGISTDEMAAQVAGSGISFDTLANIGSEAFARIYKAADGDMTEVMKLIDKYNALPFKDKKNFLKSDSSDATGKVDAVNRKPMPDKKNYLQAIDNATKVINAVNGKYLNDHTTRLYAEDHASWVIGNVIGKIASIPSSRTISLWASGGIFGHAAGGISIPRNAGGGFDVATSATLTPAGWVGEDGWEAIVPLTNRRYVRPFAQAVASEVRLPSGGDTINITVNASGDGEDIARALRREMSAWLMTQKAGA